MYAASPPQHDLGDIENVYYIKPKFRQHMCYVITKLTANKHFEDEIYNR